MVKRRLMFAFPPELIKEPVIHNLGQQFNIVTNIHLAEISKDRGWVVLELEGDEKDIEEGIAWATSKGMRVDPASGDMTIGRRRKVPGGMAAGPGACLQRGDSLSYPCGCPPPLPRRFRSGSSETPTV